MARKRKRRPGNPRAPLHPSCDLAVRGSPARAHVVRAEHTRLILSEREVNATVSVRQDRRVLTLTEVGLPTGNELLAQAVVTGTTRPLQRVVVPVAVRLLHLVAHVRVVRV